MRIRRLAWGVGLRIFLSGILYWVGGGGGEGYSECSE